VAVDGYFDDHIPASCDPAARLLGIYAR